jgi:hypothetical protein
VTDFRVVQHGTEELLGQVVPTGDSGDKVLSHNSALPWEYRNRYSWGIEVRQESDPVRKEETKAML